MNKFLEKDLAISVIKFQCIVIVALLVTLISGFVYFSWYINQWDYEVYEYEVEAEGGNAVINGEGEVIINGESEEGNQETDE